MTAIIIATVIVGTLIVATSAYFLWVWTSKRSGLLASLFLALLILLTIFVLILDYLSLPYIFSYKDKLNLVKCLLFLISFFVAGRLDYGVLAISKKKGKPTIIVAEQKGNPSRKPKCRSYWRAETSSNPGSACI